MATLECRTLSFVLPGGALHFLAPGFALNLHFWRTKGNRNINARRTSLAPKMWWPLAPFPGQCVFLSLLPTPISMCRFTRDARPLVALLFHQPSEGPADCPSICARLLLIAWICVPMANVPLRPCNWANKGTRPVGKLAGAEAWSKNDGKARKDIHNLDMPLANLQNFWVKNNWQLIIICQLFRWSFLSNYWVDRQMISQANN